MRPVYFRGKREQARGIVRRMMLMLTGREPDAQRVAYGVFLAIGFAALSSIQEDFIKKARGGTGDDGLRWKPLSPKTLAYSRRFGPGEKAQLKRSAGLGRAHGRAPGGRKGLLTAEQLKRWRKIYASRLARFLLSMPEREAKARAAKIAWATIKREGAKTMLEVYGHRQAEILRDTGVLFNSLSPGQLGGEGPTAVYTPPSGPGGEDQIFKPIADGVIVGTNVPYAKKHQEGDPARGLPARPFLPTRDTPEAWQQRWADAAARALEAGARILFETAA